MRAILLATLLAVPVIPTVAQDASHEHQRDGHASAATDPPIKITINPEVRVSAMRGGALPAPIACGMALALPVKIVNEGYLTSPLEARLVDSIPEGVSITFAADPLKGSREELRTLLVKLEKAGPVDITVAFRAKNDISDLGGRDRVHLFLECRLADALDKVTVAYRKVGEHEVLADVYRPRGNELRPLIVHIHGGALIMGNRSWIDPKFMALAQEKGYALVSIDYRLAPETKLPDIISDIEAAFTWLANDAARRFHLDTERMVVAGASAGGYLALLTGYRVTPRPKALVSLYGYGQLNADWYAKPNPYPSYNFEEISSQDAADQTDGSVISDGEKRKGDGETIYLYYRQSGLWPEKVSGFPRDSRSKLIAPFEPAKNVTRDYPPTFMMHGTQDTDVPFEESEIMASQLQAHGVPYILVPIANGDHEFVGGDQARIEAGYLSAREFMLKYLEPN